MLYLSGEGADGAGTYNAGYFQASLTASLTGYAGYHQQERPLRKNFRRYLRMILPHLRARQTAMLDVGCAYGFLLDEARKMGFSVEGLDLSGDAVRWMGAHLGIKGTVGYLSDAPPGPFDLITVSEVIEHISDPVAFAADLYSRLSDGGIAVVVTGACDTTCARVLGKRWWYLNPPDHRAIFSRVALRRLVSGTGLEIIDQRLFSYHWVGLNNGLLKLARVLGSERLGRFSLKIPPLMLPIPHGTTQFLIARRVCQKK